MVAFDLHKLGWHSFQRLCLTIVREVFGQTVQSFLDSNDGGRDGAFAGRWVPCRGEALAGAFVVQCKFTGKPGYTLQRSDVSDEIAKAARLAQRGLCDAYILMTNAGVSGRLDEELMQELRAVGINQVATYGTNWISQQLSENRRLRMLVPRVYGLGDLSQILDDRAYEQTKAILATLREDLSRVVLTDAYYRAANALDKHGFVLLLGEPASGKTTIASMLAMTATDQWNAVTLKLDRPSKVVEDHWNPHELTQFFWVDDAFGVTQYEPLLAQEWNHAFGRVRTMLRAGARIVMSSRDYIYNRARRDLKQSAFPLLAESQVVIDVRQLTLDEKRQILYNHLKLGCQPRAFRTAIKPRLENVARHERFAPEIARRLADPMFTKKLDMTSAGLSDFVARPVEFLLEVIAGLDSHSRAGLALIFMRNGALESPIRLDNAEADAVQRLCSTVGECSTALEAMRNSLVSYTVSGDAATWQFRHPTIGDAFAEFLLKSPELLEIYLRGAAIRKLITHVTCGDVGLENAVIVPKPLFVLMLHRLEELSELAPDSVWSKEAALDLFLALRCSKEFLTGYLASHPEGLERIAEPPDYYLSDSTTVRVTKRLFELGILPEDARERFVTSVIEHAVELGDPAPFRDPGIRSILRDEEWSSLEQRVREELLPRLEQMRSGEQDGWNGADEPEEHMGSFMSLCEGLAATFADEPKVLECVLREQERGLLWIERRREDMPSEPDDDGEGWRGGGAPLSESRSIFDDVDQ